MNTLQAQVDSMSASWTDVIDANAVTAWKNQISPVRSASVVMTSVEM